MARPSPAAPPARPTLVAIAVIAAGLGLGAAAGTVFTDTGTTASVSDAIAPALLGASIGLIVSALAIGSIIRFTEHWPVVRPYAATAVAVAAALGALAGASTAATELPPEPAPTATSAITMTPVGGLDATGVVVPVDRDRDGEPDTVNGEPVLGFDVDDDDVVDGFLERCSSEPDPRVEERQGYIAIDLRCDGIVDDYLPFDSARLLTRSEPTAPTAADDDGTRADTWVTIGLVVMLMALLLALAFFVTQTALRQRPLERQLVPLEPSRADPGDVIDAEEVAGLLQASLDHVLAGDDPRIAIRIAYGKLLEGLAGIGLERRPEEGPDEHMQRCLRAADLPERPIRDLLALFALARFSSHEITEAHRHEAIDALDTAIASVRRLEVVG